MKNRIELEEGYIVRLSEPGARGFFYPSNRKTRVISRCDVEPMPGWLSQEGLIPVSIPSECVDASDRYSEKPYMVVWCHGNEGV